MLEEYLLSLKGAFCHLCRYFESLDYPCWLLQALSYTRCCGPRDRSDPCKGENLVLSVVHVDHFIERAKEEEDLLSVYRWLMVKSLMSQVN